MKHLALLRCAALTLHFTAVAVSAATAHAPLDTSEGPRTPAASETITYDPAWSGGSTVTLALDGATIGTYSAAGTRTLDTRGWSGGRHTLTHTAGGETLTASFRKPFPPPTITNLTARQRYPWNGLVDIECDVLYGDPDAVLLVSIAATNLATGAELPARTLYLAEGGEMAPLGPVKAGLLHFIWNADADVADKVKFDNVALTIDVKEGFVQLWENGPYWAECNVGAIRPEDTGYYFWWGDTVGYTRNASDTGWVSVAGGHSFSFYYDSCPTYTKSASQLRSAGYIDATGNLVAAHDAATAHLGAPWRMPMVAEWDALIQNCDTTWTTRNGVNGRLVKGRGAYASKSIFLPAAGDGILSYLYDLGSRGGYWSSTPNSDYSDYAWYLNFDSGNFRRRGDGRCVGQSVRPLRGFAE